MIEKTHENERTTTTDVNQNSIQQKEREQNKTAADQSTTTNTIEDNIADTDREQEKITSSTIVQTGSNYSKGESPEPHYKIIEITIARCICGKVKSTTANSTQTKVVVTDEKKVQTHGTCFRNPNVRYYSRSKETN